MYGLYRIVDRFEEFLSVLLLLINYRPTEDCALLIGWVLRLKALKNGKFKWNEPHVNNWFYSVCRWFNLQFLSVCFFSKLEELITSEHFQKRERKKWYETFRKVSNFCGKDNFFWGNNIGVIRCSLVKNKEYFCEWPFLRITSP